MTQRLRTAKEGWIGVVKILYLVLGLPCLIVLGGFAVIAFLVSRPGHETEEALTFLAFFWVPILITLAIYIYGVSSRRRFLKSITGILKDQQFFDPDEANELYNVAAGKYLGIDTTNGTILYVHRIRKGQADVVGLTMPDWTCREVEGSLFRLYTKFPDLPRIEIATPWAQRWYDTLGAMEYKQKQYSTPQPFPQYVRDRLDALEREHNVQIPRLA